MDESTVLRDIDGSTAWLRLNRPEALNALNDNLLSDLGTALDTARVAQDVRVVVITGTGRAFCAGADLKALAPSGTVDPDALLAFVRRAAAVVEKIPALDKPVIAAVNGITAAGGLELALACDLVIAARGARIGDGHANYGLLPGAGGAARLARVVGPTVAKRLAFTGELLPAAELVPHGLIHEVVDDDELERHTNEIAARIAEKSPLVLAHMKRLIGDALDQSLPTALRAEHQALRAHAHSPDLRDGLVSFQRKRNRADRA